MLDLFRVRAASMGWDREGGPLMIKDDNGEKRSLLAEYGCISLANVLASETIVTTTDDRDTQDSYLIFHCLYNSLTRAATT